MSNKSEATWHPNDEASVPRGRYEYTRALWKASEEKLESVQADRDRLAHFIDQLQKFRLIDESPVDALERIGNLLDKAIREEAK